MTTKIQTKIKSKFFFLLWGLHSALLYSIPEDFLLLENHRIQRKIHAFKTQLNTLYQICTETETRSPSNAGYCALIRNEKLQDLSPVFQILEMRQVEKNFEFFQKGSLPIEEKLFIEMRYYAYRPKAYGQSFGRSLLAMESLKRLKPDLPHLAFYEKEIRFLQGKEPEEEGSTQTPSDRVYDFRSKSFGWIIGVSYWPHLGLEGKLGYEDASINDGPWGGRGLVFGSTKEILGASGGISFTQLERKVESNAKYSKGKKEYYDLGADSSSESLQLVNHQEIDLIALYQYSLTPQMTIALGLKLRDTHITEPLDLKYSLLGPFLRVCLDELDQAPSPRWGHRVSMYGHFHHFQQFGLEARLAVPLSLSTHLIFGGFYEALFGKVFPFSHLRLGETYPIPGVALHRYQDRTLLSTWAEMRRELIPGLGGGIFGSGSFIGDTFDASFKHRALLGAGVFIDWRWSRLPKTDARIEFARFVDETLIQVGVVQGF